MTEEKPEKKRSRVLPLVAVIVLLCGLVWVASIFMGGDEAEACTSGGYRSGAIALMNELNAITDQVDIRDTDSRAGGREEITAVLTKINQLECREAFPLKHETLEYAARHFRDALDAMDAGDLDGAAESIDAAALNAERFNDWSVDMGN